MKFPVLIGRQFLKAKFLVDVTKKNLSYCQSNPDKSLIKISTLYSENDIQIPLELKKITSLN